MLCFSNAKVWIVFWYVIFVSVILAQENELIQNSTPTNDSTRHAIFYEKIALSNIDLKSKSPLLLLGKHYDPYLATYSFVIPEGVFENKKFLKYNYYERERIRNEINQAMKVYREGQLKNDLGVVGQILGYSQTAAAFGLAIYSLAKYGIK